MSEKGMRTLRRFLSKQGSQNSKLFLMALNEFARWQRVRWAYKIVCRIQLVDLTPKEKQDWTRAGLIDKKYKLKKDYIMVVITTIIFVWCLAPFVYYLWRFLR